MEQVVSTGVKCVEEFDASPHRIKGLLNGPVLTDSLPIFTGFSDFLASVSTRRAVHQVSLPSVLFTS